MICVTTVLLAPYKAKWQRIVLRLSDMHAYSPNIESCLLFPWAHLAEIVTCANNYACHVEYSVPMASCMKKDSGMGEFAYTQLCK
jgi:hypothetical protein